MGITNLIDYFKIFKITRKFRDYKPQKVSIHQVKKWLSQFDKRVDNKILLDLLERFNYYSEIKTLHALAEINRTLLNQLKESGISSSNIIYISIDDTATSSHIMLGMLKDSERLERRGYQFIDSKNILGLRSKTYELGEGTLIYIDDFSGTGTQFCRSRDYIASTIPIIGKFSEFFLVPCVCQEAFLRIEKLGVEVRFNHLHSVQNRPLHPNNTSFDKNIKNQIKEICEEIDKKSALGFSSLATMVSFYRNTPNTTPLIFRGNIGQDKFSGILPRIQDLPPNIDK